MKTILVISLSMILSIGLHAQTVTKFLGIPVDGSKTAMISKLKAKGFKYNSVTDMLEGEFNGYDVNISVVTNNNKVWRLVILDGYSNNETDIRIRFNDLCRQFTQNKKYISAIDSVFYIQDQEDISYEMSVHSKRYEAAFYQLPPTMKDKTTLSSNMLDFERVACKERSVWLMITEYAGGYRIVMYYDNKNNHSDGEDL